MKVPRITDALGFIPEELIDEAVVYRRKRSHIWFRYAAVAACAAVVVCVGVFLRLNSTPQRSIVKFPATTVDIPEEEMLGGFYHILPPFGSSFDDVGGDENYEFYQTIDHKLSNLDMSLINLVDKTEFDEWIESTRAKSIMAESTAVDELANLYSFLIHFDIPDDSAREILKSVQDTPDGLTDEEIELVLSDDAEAVAEHFAAETAIRKGKNLYSLYWIYFHPLSDYVAAGITPEEIENKLPYIEKFGLTESARQWFESKINGYIVDSGYGVDMYTDGTLIYSDTFPTVMKEFVIVRHQSAQEEIFYLVDNDPNDGDDNIYAAIYMWDQLISSGCDSDKSFDSYQAFLSYGARSDYFKKVTPIKIGTVVRLAWDGLCETVPEGEPKRLTWLTRLQFSDSDCAYSDEELKRFCDIADKMDLDEDKFCNFAFLNTPDVSEIGNGYDLLTGLQPYKNVRDLSGDREDIIKALDESGAAIDREKYIYKYDNSDYSYSFWYCLDYYVTAEGMRSFQIVSSSNVPQRYDGWELGFADGTGKMSEQVTLYSAGDYIMLCYDYPIEQGGITVYANIYKAGESLYEGLTLSDFDSIEDYYKLFYHTPKGPELYYGGIYYHCLYYHPTDSEIEIFREDGEYIGDSVYKPSMEPEKMFDFNWPNYLEFDSFPSAYEGEPDYDRLLRCLKENEESGEYTCPGSNLFNNGIIDYYDYREDHKYDCFVMNLMPGVPLYKIGDYVMAIFDEPLYNGGLEPIKARLYTLNEDTRAPKASEEEISAYEDYLAKRFSKTDSEHYVLDEISGDRWVLCSEIPTRVEVNEFRYIGRFVKNFTRFNDWKSESYETPIYDLNPAFEEDVPTDGAVWLYISGDWMLLEYRNPADGVFGRFYVKE